MGIAPLIIGIFFIAGLQSIFLGLIGEYVAGIYMRLKNKPGVVEKEELTLINVFYILVCPKPVIFDLDGTLIDTRPLVLKILNGLRLENNFKILPKNEISQWLSLGGLSLIKSTLQVDEKMQNLA